MKIIPKNYYIGLSLIIASSYYFYKYSLFANKNYFVFLLDLSLLFFFSLFLFAVIIEIINYKNNKFFFYLKNLFYTYLSVQILKAFVFLTYSKITLSDLIANVLISIFPDLLINRIILFIFPYLLIFLFLILINFKKDKIDFLRLFKTFGFILFFFVIYREILNTIDFQNNKIDVRKNEKIILNKINTNKKVVWVLFDGFDPQIYEKYKFDLRLKNLQEFESKSVFVPKTISPASKTIDSVPSLLMGKETMGHLIKNKKYYLITENDEKILFSYQNTLFGNLSENNLNSSILSSVIQYCSSYIKSEKFYLCKEPDIKKEKINLVKILSGIYFAYSPADKIRFIVKKIFKTDKKTKTEKIDFKNVNITKDYNLIQDLDGHQTVYFSDYSSAIRNSNLTFMHLYIPHPGNFKYAEKLFGIYSEDELNSHILNLKITDIAIKKIYKEIRKYENYMIIISSDHWFRAKDRNKNIIYPSLFMASTNQNQNNFKLKNEFRSVHIQELIYKFFNNDVNTNEDIKLFIEKKN